MITISIQNFQNTKYILQKREEKIKSFLRLSFWALSKKKENIEIKKNNTFCFLKKPPFKFMDF